MNAFLKDPSNLKMSTLVKTTPDTICEWIGVDVPNASERARFVREVFIFVVIVLLR